MSAKKRSLDIVLKCDSTGSKEAITASLAAKPPPEVDVKVVHADVGDIAKSDLFLALTASRLVVGFQVGVMPKIRELSQEQGVEVRLYDVIYRLTTDLRDIAARLTLRQEEKEKIIGKAKVIALFKGTRQGVILGCDVFEGSLETGKTFRLISAMGPVYDGKIESLQIEGDTVKSARTGQKVGLKVSAFKKAKLGDLVECYRTVRPKANKPWAPRGGVSEYR
jgi:translation initiation factor IF-2